MWRERKTVGEGSGRGDGWRQRDEGREGGSEGREGGVRESEGVCIIRWYHFLIQRHSLLQALLGFVQSTNQETEHTIVIPVLCHMIST